jgi:7,8-dihydro-6-hydroxymethylpterin dimethyltransferase
MTELPVQTLSLCPHCLRRIPARRIFENDAVYLEKSCPLHGDLGKVLLWKNFPISYSEWTRSPVTTTGESPQQVHNACPYDCGLCSDHKQKTCTAIIEVTRQCDMHCPICFSASKAEAGTDPDLNQLAQILEMLQDRAGNCPIQLSGGEPALRNDLPQIIALARARGFDQIQINTNGFRLSRDPDFARAVKDAGASTIYLQFDGLTNAVYQSIRGADLLPVKLKAIERCAELKIGVILVPTLIKNINDNQIGTIIQFAKKWIPLVKGVHFQPMTYLGRYPASPRNDDRYLISDILVAIEHQTGGELMVENLIPAG